MYYNHEIDQLFGKPINISNSNNSKSMSNAQILIGVAVLVLATYGAIKLYEKYYSAPVLKKVSNDSVES
jgi:hypothetical protein